MAYKRGSRCVLGSLSFVDVFASVFPDLFRYRVD